MWVPKTALKTGKGIIDNSGTIIKVAILIYVLDKVNDKIDLKDKFISELPAKIKEYLKKGKDVSTVIDDPNLPFTIKIDKTKKPQIKIPNFLSGPINLVGSLIASKFGKDIYEKIYEKITEGDQSDQEYYWYGEGENKKIRKRDKKLVKSVLKELERSDKSND